MKRKVILTADGSSSIWIEDMNENYHSGHGALQESRHVFIRNGLDFLKDNDSIRIFEMGFGTGLNALLAAEFAAEHGILIEYVGVEAFPLEEELILELNYSDLVSVNVKDMFHSIHGMIWGDTHTLAPNFKFTKIHERIQDLTLPMGTFDIVFFDAFGPRAQGEMWELEVLQKMYAILNADGVFVTYCAKGQLKRDLRYLGFEVISLDGPPGKREMTRARKIC